MNNFIKNGRIPFVERFCEGKENSPTNQTAALLDELDSIKNEGYSNQKRYSERKFEIEQSLLEMGYFL